MTGAPLDDASLPRDNGELVFDAPWQARALAIRIVLAEDSYLVREGLRRLGSDAEHRTLLGRVRRQQD